MYLYIYMTYMYMYQCTGGSSGEGGAVHPPLDLHKIEKCYETRQQRKKK